MGMPETTILPAVLFNSVLLPGDSLPVKPATANEKLFFGMLSESAIPAAMIPWLGGSGNCEVGSLVEVEAARNGKPGTYLVHCRGRLQVHGLEETEIGLEAKASIYLDLAPVKVGDACLDLRKRALGCLERLACCVDSELPKGGIEGLDAESLSWLLAASLLLGPEEKLRCLRSRSNEERLGIILEAGQMLLVKALVNPPARARHG